MVTSKTPTQYMVIAMLMAVLAFSSTASANHKSRNSIIGTWLLEVDSGFPGAPPITALATFERGGTLIVSQNGIHENSEALDPVCGCNSTNGHGVWKRIGYKKYEFKFTFLLFAGSLTAGFPLNVTDPVIVPGQHIGYGLVKRAKVIVNGNSFTGTNVGVGLNLEGEILNSAFGRSLQSFKAKRLKLSGADIPLFN